MSHAGGCLCGAVRYRVEGPLRHVLACHCEMCRRTSGHHVAATAARRADLTVGGAVAWYASSLGVRRGFCPTCGANLFWEAAERDTVSILAGTLDAPTGLVLGGHIWCADKGDYYEIADGLPQAAGADPALSAWRP